METRDSFERTPLFYACKSGNGEVLALFLKKGKMVEDLLDLPDKESMTCLMVAAEQNNLDMVRLLLLHSANPQTRNSKGWLLLEFFIYNS